MVRKVCFKLRVDSVSGKRQAHATALCNEGEELLWHCYRPPQGRREAQWQKTVCFEAFCWPAFAEPLPQDSSHTTGTLSSPSSQPFASNCGRSPQQPCEAGKSAKRKEEEKKEQLQGCCPVWHFSLQAHEVVLWPSMSSFPRAS